MTADKSVTTTFSKITYALTVSKTGAGSGTITSNPASIDCGLTCSSNFDYNSAVTLTANPSNGSTFTGWSGAGCSGTGTCTVTMTAATSVTANFKLDCFTLTKLANPVAGGTVNASPAPNCNNGTQYSYDTVVSLTASPKTGYSFTDWSDALSGSNNPTSVTMEGDNTVTANFTDIQSPILNWSSPVGNGQVYNAGNQSIQLEVNASDNVGVSYVHFYRWDSVNLIPVDIENVYNSPYSISFDTGGLNPGWNEIDADAVDAAGNGAHNYIWINHLIPPSPFSKINPANYDTGIATNPTLSWETSNGATAYEYCYDTTDDNTCTSWHSTGTNTSVALGSLITGTTYYWQVRATNQGGATYANDDTWWSFTAQDKISPTEGSTPLTTRPTLDWEDTPGATSYTLQVSTSANFGSFIVNKTVSPSSYTLTTDLARSKWIYWRIYPKGVSPTAWSGVHKFLSASPPSVPTLSFPSDGSLVGNDTPRLDWTNSSLPSGTTFNYYQLQIATDTKFNSLVQDITINDLSISELPFTTLLNPNSKYYWRVCAFNTDGQYSLWSSTRSFRTRLPAPSLLTVIPLTTRPTFSWQAVDGATGYAIQVSTSYTYSSPILNTSTTGPTYTPTSDLPRNKTLYWRVYAKGTNPSNWEPNGFISFFSANPPSVPTLLAPSDGVTLPNYAPTLDWNDPVLADHYEVQIASASTFSEGTIVIDTSTTSISNYVPSPALAANSTFYWRVRVYDLQGQYSNWSSVRHFNTTLPAPSLISPANLATGVPLRPIFDWGDESGATSYVIQVSTSPSFTSLTINKTVTGSSYTSTSNLYLDKKYYWRVYAKGTYNSPWSGVWSFDTYINNTLFSDDFSGDLSKWSIFNGTWVIENGELSGTGHGMTEPKDGYIYAGDTAWNNYTLSAKVLSGESDFILRSTGHWQNEYRITLWPVGSSYPNTYQINKYQNGAGINLLGTERLTFPISVTGPYLVEVEVINNHIRLSINGTLVNDIVDPNPLSAGRFGLGVIWSTQNDFDDVKVVASN
jgi:hypothetical protein